MRKLALLALLAGCSVQSVTFTPDIDANGNQPDMRANTIDAGPVAIEVSPPSVPSLIEGSSTMLMVQLSNPPASSVLVDVMSSATDKISVSKAQLLFTPQDWNTPQAITITAQQDPDTVDDNVNVTFSSSTPGVDQVVVPVTDIDDDKLALIVSPSSLDVLENASAPILAHLNAQPTSDVIVAVVTDHSNIATVTPSTLTFTTANYSVDQTVTINGVKDSNKVDDSAVVSFASSALSTVQVPVTVIDIDVLAIAPSTTSIQMREGDTKTFTVALTQAPTGNVTVSVTSQKPTGAAVSPASLTFTPANWSQGQTVTVTAPQDDDTQNEAVPVTLAAAGLTTVTVGVAVTDDDVQALVVTPGSITMTENGDTTLKAHLAFKPAADTMVTVTSADPTVATVTPATMTFTPASYAADQTIMIHAPDDLDAVDDTTTITLAEAADGLSTPVPVTVHDDDTLAIQTSAPSVTLDEGATGTFTVRLTAQPQADTQVAIVSTDVGAATVSPGALTFTTANWNTPQTVTVTGVADVDTVDEHVELDLTATGLTMATVTANVNDTTGLNIQASTASLTVSENATATFTVQLTAQPVANVDVTVASADPTIATAAPATLTFTPANWNVAQVVTVTGVKDADAIDDNVNLTLSATGLNSRTVAVTVKDTDVLGIAASPTSLSVGEGATGSLGYTLTAQPQADTVVMLAISNPAKASLSASMLTFTSANWNTPQNIVVTGLQDADAVDENLTLTASATGLPNLATPVTVIDDEVLGIVVDTPTVSLIEGGTATFHAHLAAQPTADTMVTAVSGNTAKATVAPNVMTFTTANWNVDQTVTVTGVQDNDLADETVQITLASAGFPNRSVTASIADDDTQAVQVTAPNLSVTEGTTNTVGVSLAFQPSANVVVSVTSSDATIATAAPTSLTFTPQNYGTAQTVTVTGVHDANAVTDSTILTMATAGATSATVNVTVPDTDTLGIASSAPSLTLSETGTGTIGFHLTAQPQANTTVTVASSDTTKATVAPNTLTFTSANWNVNQNVTVTGVHDVDAVSASISVTASSPGLATATVPTTVTDVDTLGITASASSVSLGEGGTGTFTVKLSAQPQATTTVMVASTNTAKATVGPASLSFTTSNWNVAQTVTVSGVQDLDVADEVVPINLTATGLATVQVTANVADDDVEQILAANPTLSVNESASGSVGITLRYIPSGNVTVAIASTNTAVATVSPATMTFTPANYNVPQSVNITGVKDANAVNDTATVNLTATGVTSASIAVTVVDTDVLAIVPSPSSVTVAEGGTGTYTVTLSAQPQANTTVNLASADGTKASVSPASLTFTTSNWNAPQTVTVTGVQDLNLTNETTQINMTATGLAAVAEPVTVTDDDTQTVVASAANLVTQESSSTTFTVQLQFIPSGNVTVNVASQNTSVATVSPASLVFTPANYNTPQTVTVSGVHDANTSADSTTVQCTAVGANAATVNVTVNDIDTLGITTDVSALSVAEGAQGTINVKLNAMPAGNLIVAVASQNTGVATAAPTMLTFTTANWNTYQPVTVAGVHDSNLVNDSTTVKLSSLGLTDVNVPITVTDIDVQTVLASSASVTLNEGQTTTVGISLQYAPTSNVTVTVASGNTNVATGSPATLTFTSANYNTQQNVTITAIHDADAVNNTTNMTFSAPGANSASTTVNVTDIDTLGISYSPSTVSVGEGSTTTFGVQLTAQPLSNLTVTVTATDGTKATASPASLVFTPTNWNTAQTVTVTGTQDANLANESTTISLSSPSTTTQSVPVTVIDDDVETILASVGAVTINDAGTGNSTTVGVSLQFQPAANVTVTVASGNTGIATVSPATLTFTPTNYNTAQNVTITGVHDANAVDDSTSVALTAPGTVGANVTTNVHDTDVMTLVVSASSVTVNEGGTGTFRVHLSNLPTGTVTVNVADSNPAGATISASALTFTTANYNVDQTVTVTGVQDANVTNESATITLTATGMANQTVAVTVIDDDTQHIIMGSGIIMNENTSTTSTISLQFQPSGNVTVNLSSSNPTNLGLSPTSLTFTPSNYNIAQSYTITANVDTDSTDTTYFVTASSAGVSSNSIAVSVVDRNLINATEVFGTCLGLCPLDDCPINVHLNDSALATISVTDTTNSTTHVSGLGPSPLVFTTSNFGTNQQIDFTAQNSGSTTISATITISAPGQVSQVFNVSILSSLNTACGGCPTCTKGP